MNAWVFPQVTNVGIRIANKTLFGPDWFIEFTVAFEPAMYYL
jgi:hypothetical protein